MKKKYAAILLILFAVCATNVMADPVVAAQPPQLTVDPTLSFFTALATCAPGNYTERNDIESDIGQTWLNQIIIGQNQGLCNVMLSTPDGRNMSCAFPMDSLTGFLDPSFMLGILDNGTDDTAKDAVKADLNWSQLKINYCTFVAPMTGP